MPRQVPTVFLAIMILAVLGALLSCLTIRVVAFVQQERSTIERLR